MDTDQAGIPIDRRPVTLLSTKEAARQEAQRRSLVRAVTTEHRPTIWRLLQSVGSKP